MHGAHTTSRDSSNLFLGYKYPLSSTAAETLDKYDCIVNFDGGGGDLFLIASQLDRSRTSVMLAIENWVAGMLPESPTTYPDVFKHTRPAYNTSMTTTGHLFASRDVCGGNSSFALGQTYGQADCASPNTMLPGGMCDWWKKQAEDTQCAFFCQVSTRFLPAEEVPIPGTYCYGPKTCSLALAPDTQVSVASTTWAGTDQELYALQHGITGGFRVGSRTVAVDYNDAAGNVTLEKGQCGYFAWIGTKKVVCGSLTKTQKREPDKNTETGTDTENETNLPICHTPAETTGNVCVDQLWGGGGGESDDKPEKFGKTVFVRVDCATRAPLPWERQDDTLFLYDGVAMPRDRLDGVLQSWVNTTCKHSFRLLYYTFEARGRGLKDSALGHAGINYLKAMRRCGAAVTGWYFEYTPGGDTDSYGYDWRAGGATDIIRSDCIGSALEEVGANSRGECHGR